MEKLLVEFFVSLTFIGFGICDQVIFYDGPNYQGGTLTLSIEDGCYNFKQKWENGVASVQIQSAECMIAWDDIDCEGKSFSISTQMSNTDELMNIAGFQRRMKSVKLCSAEIDVESIPSFRAITNLDEDQISERVLKPTKIEAVATSDTEINFYDEPNFDGNIFTLTTSGGCYSFKSKWRNRISSLDSQVPLLCVIAWDNLECEGKSIRIETLDASSPNKNLKLVKFDKKIKSMTLCPKPGEENDDENSPSFADDDDSDNDQLDVDIMSIAIKEHNKFRALHGVDLLKGNPMLQTVAQTFADHLAKTDKLLHSTNIQFGENLAGISTSNKATALREAIKAWYNEIHNYDFENPRYSIRGLKAGHFTALVWKTTTHLGVGMAWNPKRRWWIVVANYNPPGNLKGTYGENVFPPVIIN